MILGPTQHRTALWLERATRHGRVTLRMLRIAAELGLERSEAYRITRRLRMLGLFGVEDDRGRTHGGRRWWRTRSRRPGAWAFDPGSHRRAWARIVASSRRIVLELAGRDPMAHPLCRVCGERRPPEHDHPAPAKTAGASFRERLARYGLTPETVETWRTPITRAAGDDR